MVVIVLVFKVSAECQLEHDRGGAVIQDDDHVRWISRGVDVDEVMLAVVLLKPIIHIAFENGCY
jgi:hypothetical protein